MVQLRNPGPYRPFLFQGLTGFKGPPQEASPYEYSYSMCAVWSRWISPSSIITASAPAIIKAAPRFPFFSRQVRLGQIQTGLAGRAPDGLCQFPGDFGGHPHRESDGMRLGHWHLPLMPRQTTDRR